MTASPPYRSFYHLIRTSPANAVYNAKVLEQCAKMAFISFAINPETTMNPLLIEKHYSRKHGPNAYYGQKK